MVVGIVVASSMIVARVAEVATVIVVAVVVIVGGKEECDCGRVGTKRSSVTGSRMRDERKEGSSARGSSCPLEPDKKDVPTSRKCGREKKNTKKKKIRKI